MTAPVPIASGMKLTPARLNRPWMAYTPTWAASSNPSIGNGVLQGGWRYLDDQLIVLRIVLRPGSTTTFGSGQYRFSLPVPAVAGGPDPMLPAMALLGSSLYQLVGWANTASGSASEIAMYRVNVTSQENVASWTNSAPVAFANGHTFSLLGTYRYA